MSDPPGPPSPLFWKPLNKKIFLGVFRVFLGCFKGYFLKQSFWELGRPPPPPIGKIEQDHERWGYSTVTHLEQPVYLAVCKRFKPREKKKQKNKMGGCLFFFVCFRAFGAQVVLIGRVSMMMCRMQFQYFERPGMTCY